MDSTIREYVDSAIRLLMEARNADDDEAADLILSAKEDLERALDEI